MKKTFILGLAAAAALVGGSFAGTAAAAFIDPSVSTYPFEAWDRGNANSTYAEWGTGNTAPTGFSDDIPGTGAGQAGVQDIDSPNSHFNAGTADVVETSGTSFLTSGFNIYSFSAATDFDVTVPSYGKGAGWDSRFVAQVRVQGTEIDLSTVTLSLAGGLQDLAPTNTVELARTSLGAQGALVDTMFVWDIADFNPSEFLLEFKALGSSMSLDLLTVDTFTVPEPASLALLGTVACAAVAAGGRRRRTA